jgi:chromosome segregation ATPase
MMIGIGQMLLSSKKDKAGRPSTAPSEPSQHPPPERTPHQMISAASVPTSELLQLRLENSDLRRRLEDALSHTDESKMELLHLLEEQTSQTNHLQSKCDELAVGFVEIDKERRLLRKSADDARDDAMHEVEQTKADCERRTGKLERHIKMREKEVEALAERIREQERRIEAVVIESNGRQARVEALEGELEGLIGMVHSEREERKMMSAEHEKSMEVARMELQERREVELGLKQRIQDLKQAMHAEEGKSRSREEMLKRDLDGKESDLANLRQDQTLSKIEHEQALQAMKDNLDAQKVAYETLRNEKDDIINTMQTKVDEKSTTILCLKSEINQLEANRRQSSDIISHLQGDLNDLRSSHHMAQEELKATIHLLERENGELTDKAAQLVDSTGKLGDLQAMHAALQTDYALLGEGHSELKEQLSALEDQVERTTAALNEEKNVGNKLRSQLRELNIQLKEDGSEKLSLERELAGAKDIVLKIQEEAKTLRARLDAEEISHRIELESLRTEHAAHIMIIETSGADVVSDLEETIGALKKELADNILKHGEAFRELRLAQERVECALSDREKVILENQDKIEKLTTYAKERKEETKLVMNDLERVRREREDEMSVIRDELQDSRVLHDKELFDLQGIVKTLRSELTAAKEQLSTKDEEFDRARATLSERTNLLRNMVNQTKSYQSDYEHEHARVDALEEAVSSYKRQLSDARNASERLEQEIHDKDTQYCDAIRNERHQHKTMKIELESLRKSTEELLRKNAEMDKNAEMLKDKVSRQEKYIMKLQDREKQNRRSTNMSTKTSGISRTSTANVRQTKSPIRAKERLANKNFSGLSVSYNNADENGAPNVV